MSEAGDVAEGKSVDVGTSGRRDGSWLLSKCAGGQKRGNAGGDAETPLLRPEWLGHLALFLVLLLLTYVWLQEKV